MLGQARSGGQPRDRALSSELHKLLAWVDLTLLSACLFYELLWELLQCFCRKLDCERGCFLSWPLFTEAALKVILGSGMWSFCPWYWSLLERLPEYSSAAWDSDPAEWQGEQPEGRVKDQKRVWHLPRTPDRVAYAGYAAETSCSTCSVVHVLDLCNVCPGNC